MRRFFFPLILGTVGAAILIALGVWQLQRMEWKRQIVADIEWQISAPPRAIPAMPDPVADRYMPVRAKGRTGEGELHVLVSQKVLGAGFRIITPFETDDGRTILLDRGFVPSDEKTAPRSPFAATFEGNLHWPDERDRFTPQNDVVANYWFSRDVDAMAAELDTEPVLLVASGSEPPDPDVTPLPVGTEGIPDNHLGYAIQWFGLALVWLVMTGFLIRRLARRPR